MGLNIDLDRARQVVQGLKGLGDHLVPAGAPAAESADRKSPLRLCPPYRHPVTMSLRNTVRFFRMPQRS